MRTLIATLLALALLTTPAIGADKAARGGDEKAAKSEAAPKSDQKIEKKTTAEMKSPPTQLLHTSIWVKNMDKSIEFYTKQLGMTLQRRMEIQHDIAEVAFLGIAGTNHNIELIRQGVFNTGLGRLHVEPC